MSKTLEKILAVAHNGTAGNEVDAAIGRLTLKVQETLKKGEVVIKLQMAPVNQEAVEVQVVIDEKPPKENILPSRFYTTPEGNLTRQKPGQADLPFAKSEA